MSGKQCYKRVSELTPEQLEARRAKGRRDAARLRARRSEDLNAQRRQRYVEDEDHREKLRGAALEYYYEHRVLQNMRRFNRKAHASMRQLHSWGTQDVAIDAEHGYLESLEWYERWFASLDEPELEVW